MGSRTSALLTATLSVLAVTVALVPLRAEQIHRHTFSGRQTVLVRGDANVKVEELEHDISTQSFKSQPSSEHIKISAEGAPGDSAYIYYYYDTPPAPINELLSAGVWVKAYKAGVQLRARVVFPKEPDPANPQLPLTSLLVSKTYEKVRNWEKLTLDDVPELLAKHLPVLQARIGRAVNTTDAYIDRLVLNLYTGPGAVDVWVDDLEIGPVKAPERPEVGPTGMPVGRTKPPGLAGAAHGRLVEQRGGQLMVDNRPFLFRAIRHTGTPLYALKQAGFDSIFLPPDASPELLDEAARENWLVIPSIPALSAGTDEAAASRDADALVQGVRKFGGVDVLFWDLGTALTGERADRLFQISEVIRSQDPRRPRGGDVWDGFQPYSHYLDVVGAHRWPLFTSLSMTKYRDWLTQRKTLTAARATYWTWVQNHLPDWYITGVLGKSPADDFPEPIGPHPEQVRLMTFIALASGCNGLGFWSDRFLADSHQGRDRLQGMALLNAEVDMLGPCLSKDRNTATVEWVNTSEPNVKAALIQSSKGTVVLPMWLGPNTQFVPDACSVPALKLKVPLVADGADAWRVTPAGLECLTGQTSKIVGGTELTINDFDTAAAIVFTNDRAGLVVWWQDYVRKYGRISAQWALDMAAVEFAKVKITHMKLTAQGHHPPQADLLLTQAHAFHEEARKNFSAELYYKSYQASLHALRQLRVLMADHWRMATVTLDTPTASPYAVSFFSLPRHWELFRELQGRHAAENLLPGGDFELPGHVPDAGARVENLPGWSARFGTLDRVEVAAGIIGAQRFEEKPRPREAPKPIKGLYAAGREIHPPDEGYVRPTPELGRSLLKMEVRRPEELDKDGKKLEWDKRPLERTFLAVESPPVRLPPGTPVKVSAWIKVPAEVEGSADGVLFYDDAAGEPLAVRVAAQKEWRQFHLYRVVPASGQISVTLALTGLGVAYFDNVAIQPMIPNDPNAAPAPPAANSPIQAAGFGPQR